MNLVLKFIVIFSILNVSLLFDLVAVPIFGVALGLGYLSRNGIINFSQIGGSGKYRNYYIPSKSRKEAEEKARRDSGGRTPKEHKDHFHSVNGKGEKKPGSHFGYKGKGKKNKINPADLEK